MRQRGVSGGLCGCSRCFGLTRPLTFNRQPVPSAHLTIERQADLRPLLAAPEGYTRSASPPFYRQLGLDSKTAHSSAVVFLKGAHPPVSRLRSGLPGRSHADVPPMCPAASSLTPKCQGVAVSNSSSRFSGRPRVPGIMLIEPGAMAERIWCGRNRNHPVWRTDRAGSRRKLPLRGMR
jgi:hypothetical protein